MTTHTHLIKFAQVSAIATLICFAQSSLAQVAVGQMAPEFSATDVNGKVHKLSDYKGKTVVLEWVNPGCPFVKKHYVASTNMQATQKQALARQNVVWLAVNSTEKNHVDYMAPAALGAWMKQYGAQTTAVLMDESGNVGKAYGAKTTPHMYIINPKGLLAYVGGIDSIRTASAADIPKASNFVNLALAELDAGKAITTSSSIPYGCSVKYKS